LTEPERRGYAALDESSRQPKAEKLVRLLGGVDALRGRQILDVGCGSGHIAAALAELAGPDGRVVAVDLRDERVVTGGYEFRRVDGTALPFPDASFDVVVSNHVIEHVGVPTDQLLHLREIRRVLRPGGRCYLAAPSRWTLVEPHVRLPLVSWLPAPLRSPYVRLARRGDFYDCELPTRGGLLRLAAEAGLDAEERTQDALLEVGRLERPPLSARLVLRAPAPLRRVLLRLSPTLVFLLRRPA
jgi:SAM-dependent methyltransferase